MSSGEQITLEHPLHGVFAEHLHHPAVGGEFAAVVVFGEKLLNPEFLADRINRIELVRRSFVGTEDSKVAHVQLHHIPQ